MTLLKLLVVSILSVVCLYCLSFYIKGNLCHLKNRIDDKVVLITGANTGIGLETAIELAKRGGIIHLGCRNQQRCEDARNKVLLQSKTDESKVFTHTVDLGSIKSILAFTEQFKKSAEKLDILINNAGIMMCPYQETIDGFEMQIGVNHLGHFLLTNELLDLIKNTKKSRIIIVSSKAHERGEINMTDINLRENEYSRISAYSQSKLANVLHAKYLAKLLKPFDVSVISLHPGVVNTELMRYLPISGVLEYMKPALNYFLRTPYEGSQTSVCCAVNPDIHQFSGKYFNDCQPTESTNSHANDEKLAEYLWQLSTNLIDSKVKSLPRNVL